MFELLRFDCIISHCQNHVHFNCQAACSLFGRVVHLWLSEMFVVSTHPCFIRDLIYMFFYDGSLIELGNLYVSQTITL